MNHEAFPAGRLHRHALVWKPIVDAVQSRIVGVGVGVVRIFDLDDVVRTRVRKC